MGNPLVSSTALLYAGQQAKLPSAVLFGDREWETALLFQQANFEEVGGLGHIILDHFVKRARRKSKEYLARMRSLLTFGAAPLYFTIKTSGRDNFVYVFQDDWDVLQQAYSRTNAIDRAQLARDVRTAMVSANALWSKLFLRMSHRAQLTAYDQYFVLAIIYILLTEEGRYQRFIRGIKKTTPEQFQRLIKSSESDGMPTKSRGIQPIEARWTLDDIGGCRQAKKAIGELAWLLVKPAAADSWGVTLPVGVLLNGPPGCGKTMLAHALARHAHKPLYSARMSDIFSMWYGESTRNLAAYFQAVRTTGGILFFDEADGAISSRTHHSAHEASIRVVNEFSRQIEDVPNDGSVIIVLATNFKENLDEAAVRAKRVDAIIAVGCPDLHERREILDLHRNAAEKLADKRLFADDTNWDAVAKETNGFSGADLAAVIENVLRSKAVIQARDDMVAPAVNATEVNASVQRQREERRKGQRDIGFQQQNSASKAAP